MASFFLAFRVSSIDSKSKLDGIRIFKRFRMLRAATPDTQSWLAPLVPSEVSVAPGSKSVQPVLSFPLPSGGPQSNGVSLEVTTINGNSWGTAYAFLKTTSSHVVLVQEHRIRSQDEIFQKSQICKQIGFKTIWAPGLPGDG